MSGSAKTPRRFLIALNLPEYEVPLFVSKARFIVERMTGNAWFPSPDPPLADIQAALDDLAKAETTAFTRALGAVAARNEKRLVLVARLQHLQAYVQAIATANLESAASIIESAGMDVKKVGKPPPRAFGASPGRVSGDVDLVVPSAGDRAAYEFQHSLDAGKTWLGLPDPVATKTKVTVRGLTPGATVHFRVRATVKGATGDWSQMISIIVE